LLVSADPAKTVVREKEYQATVFGMRSIDSIAEDYVERAAALDPALATVAGIAGHDRELPDLSADGFAERAGLDRSTLAALDAAEAPGLREQTARAAMQERLAVAVERYDAGDTTSDLNVIDSWVQYVREVFDLMPAEGEEASGHDSVPDLPDVRACARRPPKCRHHARSAAKRALIATRVMTERNSFRGGSG
jgi:uncharacterized protein (DUF885 family)